MSFYSSIAENYAHIFPYNPAQFTFISQNTNALPPKRVLEIGSATGILTAACHNNGLAIEGLELDAEMVKIARKNHPGITFKEGNMLNIDSLYDVAYFNTLICFGNTLVHLQDLDEIAHFLAKAYKLLQEEGVLLVQFINYDRILNQSIQALPSIENEHLTFERHYEVISDTSIDFNTKLHIHKQGTHINNTQRLFPLRRKDFESLAKKTGFTTDIFGSFMGSEWKEDSMQSIFVCKKQRIL